jgi:hypothetical protein
MDDDLREDYFSLYGHLDIPDIESWLARPNVGGAKPGLEFMLRHRQSELESAKQIDEGMKHSEIIKEAKEANRLASEANGISRTAESWAKWSLVVAVVSAIIALLALFLGK